MDNKNELLNIKLNNNTINSKDLVDIINYFRNIESEKLGEDKKHSKPLLHKNLLSKIRKEIEVLNSVGLDGELNFKPSSYINSQNKEQVCYNITRDGMITLLNSESVLIRAKTIQYIDKLEEENKKLKETISEKDRLLLGLFSDDKMVVAQSHKALVELEKKPLLDKIEEDKPKVTFADTIIESSDTIDISKLAKLVKDENIPLGRNKLFQWLRDNKYLMKDNIPYQRYIDMKLFECKEYTYKTPYGDKNGIKTLVTGKGQVYIIEKLKECFK